MAMMRKTIVYTLAGILCLSATGPGVARQPVSRAGKALYTLVKKRGVRKTFKEFSEGGLGTEYFVLRAGVTRVHMPVIAGPACDIMIANAKDGYTRELWRRGQHVPFKISDADCSGNVSSVKAIVLGGKEVSLSQGTLDMLLDLTRKELQGVRN